MGTKVFVGNLSFEATEQDLQDLFSSDGHKVDRVSIVNDRETGRSRGFAFVEMASAADAGAVISAFDGKELHGRPLRVNEAHDKPKGDRPNRGGGGGRY